MRKSLTGTWKLIGLFENNLFIEDTLNQSFNSENEQKTLKILTQEGLIEVISQNDTVISKKYLDDLVVLQIDLEDKLGYYNRILDYKVEGDSVISFSDSMCPTLVELIYENKQYLLQITGFLYEEKEVFYLNEDTLRLKLDTNKEERFIKISNNAF